MVDGRSSSTCLGFQVSGFQGFGFKVWGAGLGFGVSGSGNQVQGGGFKVSGLGFTCCGKGEESMLFSIKRALVSAAMSPAIRV